MSNIKAPYNFIPVSEKVVVPYWADHISQDIPFKNGQSGKIKVRIEAKSSLFVRDGTKRKTEKEQDENQKEVQLFSRDSAGNFIIPGSSLKGMIRNVLEIMTFSKMVNKVNDHRYAVRDLSPGAKEIYLNKFKAGEVSVGWLSGTKEKGFKIEDCGEPGRVSHRHLDYKFGTDFSEFFLRTGRFDQKDDKQKAAQFKYKRFNGKPRKHKFNQVANSAGRKIFEVDGQGNSGTIVFTGQPGPRFKQDRGRKLWTGHHLEFIFFEKKRDLVVEEDVMENFFFAYYEDDKNRWSIDYKHWRKELLIENNSIPVFFRKNSDGQVIDLGLSYLYKLPYKNSVLEAIPQNVKEENIDLSEAIFGYINEEKESLKGRIQIGHARAIQAEEDKERDAVLSGPKASFYPNYIRQGIHNGRVQRYNTFMDKHAEIAGWKRYPIHSGAPKENPGTDNVSTCFKPLKKGAIFEFTIRYHNLKSIELGALLSALTFHQTENTYHSLGMGKPLGYGKIELELLERDCREEQEDHLKRFEAFMSASLEQNWAQTNQITELITMVTEQDNRGNSKLEYMTMGKNMKSNQFVTAKKNKEALNYYSELDGIKVRSVKSLITNEDINTARENILKGKQQFSTKKSYEDILEDYRNRVEVAFYRALEEKKATLMKACREKIEVLEQKATESRKEERAKQAKEGKPQWETIDWNKFKKAIERYVEDYNYGSKYKKLLKEMPQGVLPTELMPELIEKIKLIKQSAKPKELKRWKANYKKNPYLKKIAEWIGVEEAKKLDL